MLDNTIQSKLDELKDFDVRLETQIEKINDDKVIVVAWVLDDETGDNLSNGHACVSYAEAGSKYVEWAETIALRRAIGFFLRNHAPSVEELEEAALKQADEMIQMYRDGKPTWMMKAKVAASTNPIIKSRLQSAFEYIMSEEVKKSK